MRSDLIKVVHNIVLDSPTPAKALAKELGKPYSTLLREINPYDSGAKLGVETMLQIMQITGNVTPLEYMADQLGYTLEPKRMNSKESSRASSSSKRADSRATV